MNTEPRVASAFSRRTPLLALLLALGIGAPACGRQLNPVAQPDPAVQQVSAAGAEPPASPPPPIQTAALPPAPVPATFDVAALSEKVKPMVVNITTTQKVDVPGRGMGGPEGMDPFEFFFGQRGGGRQGQPGPRERSMKRQALGTGFIIDPQGYVVTNEHVIHDADDVRVHLADERQFEADVVGRDPKLDLALLRLRGAKDLPAAPLGSSEQLRVGEYVLAVGNPFGLGHTVTLGIVSAKARSIGAGPYDDFIQIDAPVNKGNSGGPTFDVDGNVIGVNTAIFSPSGGSVGIAFAIPAPTVKSVVAQLKDNGKVTRGWMGVQIQPVTAEIADGLGMKSAEGALVSEPQANSPAAKAGILAGDVITAVNGHAVKDARDLAKQIAGMAPGSSVKLTVMRKGEEKSISVPLGELPNQREAKAATPDSANPGATDVPRLGLTVAPAGQVAGSGSEGVVVTDVDPNGIASDQGFKTGDVILEVAGKKVANPADVRNALSGAQKDGKKTILMRVKSGEETRFVAIKLSKA
jgi:serine protease Do